MNYKRLKLQWEIVKRLTEGGLDSLFQAYVPRE